MARTADSPLVTAVNVDKRCCQPFSDNSGKSTATYGPAASLAVKNRRFVANLVASEVNVRNKCGLLSSDTDINKCIKTTDRVADWQSVAGSPPHICGNSGDADSI
jgi:hypothetical protein